MESICVNTTTLSNVVNDLNNTRKYYNNKKNTFYAGAFSSTSNLSNYINKVRSNYVDIHNNIMNVALLLEDYYKDIEGIENKFCNNTGYIDDSATSSIASKYANSLIDYTVSGDDLFQVNKVETVIDNVISVADAVVDSVETIAATGAVITTSVVSGIGDVVEGIVDGGAWVVKGAISLVETGVNIYLTLAEAECRVASDITSLLGFDVISDMFSDTGDAIAKSKDTESQVLDNIKSSIKEFIAEDHVESINQAFYENTSIGQAINEASAIKYDSELAGNIENVSEEITKFVGATAATILSGGAAAFALGGLYGVGTQAESTYQENGTDSTLLQEVMIAGSGALTGLSWMANGRLGSGFVEIAQSAATIGGSYSSVVGWKQIAKQVFSEVTSKEFLVDTLKEGLASKSAIGNYVSSAMMMADDFIPYLTGEETLELSDVPGLVGKYLLNLGLNVAEDGLRSYVGSFTLNSENQQLIYQRYLNGEITLEELQQKGLAGIVDNVTLKNIDSTVKDIDITENDITAPMDTTSKLLSQENIDAQVVYKLTDDNMEKLMDKYNTILDSDSRLAVIMMSIRNGEEVIIPDDLQTSYQELITIEKMLNSEVVTAGDINTSYASSILNELFSGNTANIKNELLSSISDDMTETEKARMLYVELNKKLHYSMDYFAADSSVVKTDIYNTTATLESFDESSVICKSWSELYQELLISAGFDSESVTIKKTSATGINHNWIEVSLSDGSILIADATESVNGSIDLLNCKTGNVTGGFAILDSSYSGTRLSKLAKSDSKIVAKYNSNLTSIDENIGYKSTSGYFSDIIEDAKNSFSDNSLMQELFGDDVYSGKVSELINADMPDNIDGFEAYTYYRTMKNVVFDSSAQDVKIGLIANKVGITVEDYGIRNKYEGLATIKTSGECMAYSESLGKVIFDNAEQLQDFLNTLDIKVIR